MRCWPKIEVSWVRVWDFGSKRAYSYFTFTHILLVTYSFLSRAKCPYQSSHQTKNIVGTGAVYVYRSQVVEVWGTNKVVHFYNFPNQYWIKPLLLLGGIVGLDIIEHLLSLGPEVLRACKHISLYNLKPLYLISGAKNFWLAKFPFRCD